MPNLSVEEMTQLLPLVSQSQDDRTATILAPHQDTTFSFLGNTITCKFNCNHQGSIMYEFLGAAGSGVPPLHTHPWNEAFYFLDGEVLFQIEDQGTGTIACTRRSNGNC